MLTSPLAFTFTEREKLCGKHRSAGTNDKNSSVSSNRKSDKRDEVLSVCAGTVCCLRTLFRVLSNCFGLRLSQSSLRRMVTFSLSFEFCHPVPVFGLCFSTFTGGGQSACLSISFGENATNPMTSSSSFQFSGFSLTW